MFLHARRKMFIHDKFTYSEQVKVAECSSEIPMEQILYMEENFKDVFFAKTWG